MPHSNSNQYTAFFYGTLMAPSVLKRVTSHDPASTALPLTSRPAILYNHRRHRVKGADYPAVIPSSPESSKEKSVRGTVVEGLTKEDIWRLDVFEGDEYERRAVSVQVLSAEGDNKIAGPTPNNANSHDPRQSTQEELKAETYIWIAGEHRLDDQEWDFDEFVKEKMWRWAPSEDLKRGRNDENGIVKVEDEGFEDVRRAVEERKAGGQEPDHDATGGRLLGGSFEDTIRQGQDRERNTQLLESAV